MHYRNSPNEVNHRLFTAIETTIRLIDLHTYMYSNSL